MAIKSHALNGQSTNSCRRLRSVTAASIAPSCAAIRFFLIVRLGKRDSSFSHRNEISVLLVASPFRLRSIRAVESGLAGPRSRWRLRLASSSKQTSRLSSRASVVADAVVYIRHGNSPPGSINSTHEPGFSIPRFTASNRLEISAPDQVGFEVSLATPPQNLSRRDPG